MEAPAPNANVCVVGLWHLGMVTAACLSDHGYRVMGTDLDVDRVATAAGGRATIFEPGLDGLLEEAVDVGRLAFTSDLAAAVASADTVWITIDVPVDENDRADVSPVFESVRALAPGMRDGTLLIVSSQVPVGSCDDLGALLRELRPELGIGIACVPENLRLGVAIERFVKPDMMVIGADDEGTRQRVDALLGFVDAPRAYVGLRTAEVVKHAINAYLATSISFGNQIGNLCELVGADGLAVAEAIRMDRRIGPHARVVPGLGFSGGTLARDLRYLQDKGRVLGVETPMVDAVLEMNASRNRWLVDALGRRLDLATAEVAVLGLTYTAGTDTLRRSGPVEIVLGLAAKGAGVRAFDPKADAMVIEWPEEVTISKDAYSALDGADALLILTNWDEFRHLDLGEVAARMRSQLVLDPWGVFDKDELAAEGLQLICLGQAPQASV